MMQVFHQGQLEHPRHCIDSLPPGGLHLPNFSARAAREPGCVWAYYRLRRLPLTGELYLKIILELRA